MNQKDTFKIFLTITPSFNLESFFYLLEEKKANIEYFFRINGSHSKLEWVKKVSGTFLKRGFLDYLFYDIPHRKLRVRSGGDRKIVVGDFFIFSSDEKDKENLIFVDNLSLILDEIKEGDLLILDDGKLEFLVVKKVPGTNWLNVKSLSEGLLRNGAGCWVKKKVSGKNAPEIFLNHFRKISSFKIKNFMLSFAKDGEILKDIESRKDFHFMAKIEDEVGFFNLEKLINSFDSICVARGDLGANINFPRWVKICDEVIKECVSRNKNVFLAGETFISTIYRKYPSRSEVSDFYHYLEMGINGIILSDEVIYGKNIFDFLNFLEELMDYYVNK